MLVNADFSQRAIVTPAEYRWVASPQQGVDRVMLDRLGDETGRATSIVRYAAGSVFPRHEHPGGEEVLVLSGSFSEGDQRYPAGWYLRNPPGSAHRPSSEDGATLFVKLWQMAPDDDRRVRIDTRDPASWQRSGGREVCPLFSHAAEQVCLQRLGRGELLFAGPAGSAELLVLAGDLVFEHRSLEAGSWMRLPAGLSPPIAAGAQGATVYLKTGHLPATKAEA